MAPRQTGNFRRMIVGCHPTFSGRLITLVSPRATYLVEQGHHSDSAATAPEYALDEVLSTASDMYSLGCLIHAVHLKGEPPFKNFGNLGSLREHAGRPLSGISRLDRDLQGMSHFHFSVHSALLSRVPWP